MSCLLRWRLSVLSWRGGGGGACCWRGGGDPGGDGGFELDDWFCLVLREARCLR
jgi:hypothetical protein